MAEPQLIYFADPMCSWCWGFAPTIAAIRDRYGDQLPVSVILGGLRPGTIEPMTPKLSETIRDHWRHVAEASGQPFDFAFFDRKGFIYDTEPSARAVVAMRSHSPERALSFMNRIQRAFYAENRDITDIEVLAELALQFGLTRAEFLADMASDTIRNETLSDFMVAQRTGVTGFPTLIAGTGGSTGWALITEGFQPKERILALLERWQAQMTVKPQARP